MQINLKFKKKDVRWYLLRLFSNLQFSIILLLVIASFSVIGTIIEQNKDLDFYQAHYSVSGEHFIILNWKNIELFGLNHVYTTWWFLTLLFIFSLSLLVCSLSRQIPSLQNARRWCFYKNPNQFKKFTGSQEIQKTTLHLVASCLQKFNYHIFQQGNSIYCYKGLLGRLAPIFVHASIILLLIGSVLGLVSGFSAQEMVPSGELFRLQNIIASGQFSYIPQDFSARVNNFIIEYNQDNSISQFFSDISILDTEGTELKHSTIHVNSPLQFKGLTIYQTDWDIIAIRIKINNTDTLQIPLKKVVLPNNKIWVGLIAQDQDNQLALVLQDLQKQATLYNKSGEKIMSVTIGEKYFIDNNIIAFLSIVPSTGLQIKSDPGIPIVYTSFFFLITSVSVSYISYSQIWIIEKKHRFYIGGVTNRAQLTFEEELLKISNRSSKI
uniref:Cytochrome c biogenesis protein Ccs1 n=1 Tax=Porphyra purpurea TaxID=2787 RepID=CCS1_PORPU|nr:c-type cytochrome biogenensis protein [Porphyra purpurea]P51363.1 RecName: Full=Cytochrome c biogenesis protein Ccs1; AltName: Full=ORF437 [Porphyra purpurea]AAC08249.1 ORF437 [Porphyra purpurea]